MDLSHIMENVIVDLQNDIEVSATNLNYASNEYNTIDNYPINTSLEPNLNEYQAALQSLEVQYNERATQYLFEQNRYISKDPDIDSKNNLLNSTDEKISVDNKLNSVNSEICQDSLCRENQEQEYGVHIKKEFRSQINTTPDESMAAEALRQLGEGVFENDNLVPPIINCENCKAGFNSKKELQEHLNICRNNFTLLPCNHCRITFSKEIDLHRHMVAHHTEKSYKCYVCSLEFQRPSSLTNHMKIHNYLPGRDLFPEAAKFGNNSMVFPELPVFPPQTWSSFAKLENAEVLAETPHFLTPSDTIWNSQYNYNMNDSGMLPVAQEMSVDTSYSDEQLTDTDVDVYPSARKTFTTSLEDGEFVPNASVKVEFDVDLTQKLTNFNTLNLPDKLKRTKQLGKESKVETINGKRHHICLACGVKFTRAKALIAHTKFHDTHDCKHCEKVFTDVRSLCFHMETCIHDQAQKDVILNGVSQQNGMENICTKTTVKIAKHACTKCDKKFATKQKMFRHMWIHRKKIFTCEVCAITFTVQTELDEHRLSVHPGDTPYVCQECGKCFASRQGLWEHGRVHGGGTAGLFKCTECGKSFASRQGYLIHTRTHTGERPYGCRYCWKAFRDGGTLRKHERIHTGERPHACPLCPRAFNQKVVLREHVRWVHAEIKARDANTSVAFTCQLCAYNCTDREELCAHIVKHSDQIAAIAKENANKNQKIICRPETFQKVKTKKSQKRKKMKCKSTNSDNSDSKCVTPKISKKPLDEIEEVMTGVTISKADTSDSNFNDILITEATNCDMCGGTFLSKEELFSHVRIHIH